jgi:hypothetical protein
MNDPRDEPSLLVCEEPFRRPGGLVADDLQSISSKIYLRYSLEVHDNVVRGVGQAINQSNGTEPGIVICREGHVRDLVSKFEDQFKDVVFSRF